MPGDEAGVDPVNQPSMGRARVAGLLAGALALSTASVVDALSSSVPSLVGVVGQAFIRVVPGAFQRLGIEAAGTADKPVLVVVTVMVALAIGMWTGRRSVDRPWVAPVTYAAFATLVVICAIRLENVSVTGTAVGVLVAAVVGIVCLRALLLAADPARPSVLVSLWPRRTSRSDTSSGRDVAVPGSGISRRRFITAGSVVAGGTGALLTGAWALRGRDVSGQSAAIHLPTAAEPAGAIDPAAAEFATRGASPLITPNSDFFRIDEALMVPSVDVDTWRLRITGMVAGPYELTYADLLGMPLVERHITLSCVSNEVGGPLVGTARWLGVRLSDLLARAGVETGATQLVGRAVDGFTVGFPTEVAMDGRDALVAVGMNGEPLPRRHGFPARLVVPGLYGYVSATKWLSELELTTWEAFDAYWVKRSWAPRAPVKVQSRIDVPRDHRSVAAGRQTVAGVAWAPNRGVGRVEVRVGTGPWQEAVLGPSIGDDAWRQWLFEWDAAPGRYQLSVRATTLDEEVQTSEKSRPFPDGATGHHQVDVRVTAPG